MPRKRAWKWASQRRHAFISLIPTLVLRCRNRHVQVLQDDQLLIPKGTAAKQTGTRHPLSVE
uniref:Uncharacterized protein n=1 Tax=Anguilla anguilla TaxID=7936 RepID=A0A0E9SMF1_ANGAN